MLKMRLTGPPSDVQKAFKELKNNFFILSVSPVYHNRNSKYVRIYVDADFKSEDSA